MGGDRVGSLLLRAPQPEGPEPRQEARVDQLLPTVALVARAVGLAVEAEHARQDVTRQREAERARILEDLHDGLGPVLAGMSMRVQAQLRTEPGPLLSALATELAECRGDLRRIVSGLTPSALAHDDLPRALERLVQSFGVAVPSIELTTRVDGQIAPAVAVAVYRCVAEGITNAVRHAGRDPGARGGRDPGAQVVVEISDDGAGGRWSPVSVSPRCGDVRRPWAVGSTSTRGDRHPPVRPAPHRRRRRMTRVLLVDDHPIVLSGLAALVQSDAGLQLVGTGAPSPTCWPCPRTDVAVVDLELPDGDGIDLGRRLKERWPVCTSSC